MIFNDPIRTIQAEIPAGWVYDPFNSTLTDFVFSRWDQPQEMIAVHVRRATIPSSQPDVEWVRKISAETKGNATLVDLLSDHGRAVVAEFKSNRGWVQRVAFVRGPHVELVVEQRSALQIAQNIWEPLERAVRTAASDANLEPPEDGGPEEFNKSVQEVNQAFEKDDHHAIENALKKSIDLGRSAWLRSMAMPDRALEVNAAVRVAQAMMHLGLFTGEPSQVRDAEFLLRRAQHSLEAAELETDWAQELEGQISETLKSIWSGLLQPSEPESSENMFPILSLRERGFRSASSAAKAFEDGDFENALSMAGAAVDDILSLIAFLRQNRTQEIPEDIVAHLSEQGIADKEQQIDAIQKAREALLFPPLNMAVQIRYCCALERRDVEAATESVAVRAPLAQLIFDSNPEDTGTALNLALAMMDCAGAAAFHTDGAKLDEAARCLDEAGRILGSIDGRQGGNNFWIRYHKNQLAAALNALGRSLAIAEQEKASFVVQDLSALCSRFQTISSIFQEAAAKAAPPNAQTGDAIQ
jgi:hypothetical protein